MASPTRNPIAVVGVGALFPGSVNAEAFWRNILEGNDLVTEVPATHWLIEDYYDPDPKAPDKTYARRGAFLPDIDFDALAWGIPPSILPATDTSQLLALEVAKRVLEDVAQGPYTNLDVTRTSVILGVTSAQELLGQVNNRLQHPMWRKALREHGLPEDEVEVLVKRIGDHFTPWQEATFPGLLGNVVAGRIANRLNLGGTNCVTDAACASTFSALSMSVNELAVGDSDMVVCGGVDTMNDIFMYMCFSKTPALSKTGDCRPFSAQGDGTLLGEGLGLVALKRLEDAEANGDRIYGVIRAVGQSSDGRAKSVYAPLPRGQASAIRRAYDRADVSPETIELLEAHGTGTVAGDAAEFGGLERVYGETERVKTDPQWCALGSVKSQIGHTKSAAGAAGLFKALMAVHHKTLPPTIKVDAPNPKMNLQDSGFYLNLETRPWVRAADHPRRAGVSSFGFGGSNFHVVVEEYTGSAPRPKRLNSLSAQLVTLSGASPEAVSSAARSLADRAGGKADLAQIARESHASFGSGDAARLAVVASSLGDLADRLRAAADRIEQGGDFSLPGGTHFATGAALGPVAFLFPGQGSQALNMGAGVACAFDDARAPWDRMAEADRAAGRPALHRTVFPPSVFNKADRKVQLAALTETDKAQPAIGVTSLGYLALARTVGLKPVAVAGHSFGELTALHAAGVFDEAAYVQAAVARGSVMAAEAAKTPGAMTAVKGEKSAVLAALADAGVEGVVPANHNAPDQLILSGPTGAIEAAEAALKAAGLRARRLGVATAFHSPVVSNAMGPFRDALGALELHTPQVPVWSNPTAAPYGEDADAIRDQLSGALGEPVRFVELIEGLYDAGPRVFVEVGPGKVLTALVGRILKGRPHRAIALDAKKDGSVAGFFAALAELAAAGVSLDLPALLRGYVEAVDPASLPKPKLAIAVNGANHGKPYPPKGGAAALPKPNPPRAAAAPAKATADAVAEKTPRAALPLASSGVAPTPPPAVSAAAKPATPSPLSQRAPAPAPLSETSMSDAPSRDGQSVVTAPAPQLSADAQIAWVQAYTEVQRQTAEAHAAFQQAMTQSHTAFLQAAEAGFAGLSAMMTGQAVAAPQPRITTSAPTFSAPAPSAPAFSAPAFTAPPAPVAAPPAPVAAPPAPVAAAPAPVAAAPTPVAPTAAAPAPGRDLQALLLGVVAEKTGYPAEMLTLDMDLEGDLGVDSIKRVEILGAIQEAAPELPEVDNSQLAEMRTLGQIAAALGATGGAVAPSAPAPSAAAAPAPAGADATALLLEVVAEKTGYPAEMLSMDMDLEGDLGVDSIKRVEILGAMQEAAPELPELDPAAMGELRTLGQIAAALSAGAAPAQASSVAPAAEPSSSTNGASGGADLTALVLSVVADKTGYPAEMLSPEMELEGDLGIDSIKRVEILSAVQEQAPDLPELEPSSMADLTTLGRIISALESHAGRGSGEQRPFDQGAAAPVASAPVDFLGRYALTAVPAPATGLVPAALRALPGPVVVVDGGSGLAADVAAALEARGVSATAVADGAALPQDLGGVVVLAGLTAPDPASSQAQHALAFRCARHIAQVGAAGRLFVTVQNTGGRFGLTPARAGAGWLGGFAGLARTASLEWPGAVVKAVDVDGEEVATRLAAELVEGGPEVEVGLAADGSRWTLRSDKTDPVPSQVILDNTDVVVVSGGARGVTAETMVALAQASRARFVLLGRTPLADEPAAARGAHTDAALKRALLLAAKAEGRLVKPAELGKQVKRILAGREVRGTLQRIAAVGGQARYEAVDVTDAAGVASVLDRVRADWGPVTALVHGAGVIADKPIADKTDDAFAFVFRTKIDGARALLDATAADSLKALVFFSSVAARCGNVGQCDYAMANEVLNKLALDEQRRRPGAVVRSLGWGPWAGGMVTPALKRRFEAMGVPLIALDAGARALVHELMTRGGPTEVVLGGRPRPEALLPADAPAVHTLDLWVGQQSDAWLADHTIQGAVVVPVVLAVEWFTRAARALRPDLHLHGIEGLKVLGGIRLDAWPQPTRFSVEVTEGEEGEAGLTLLLALKDAGGKPRYRATARMGVARRDAGAPAAAPAVSDWGDRPVYDGHVLFHGEKLQVLSTPEGVSDAGLVASLEGLQARGWSGSSWQTDVAAYDGALQLAVLWGREVLGGGSLPMAIGAVETFAGPSGAALRGVVSKRSASKTRAVSDVTLVDTGTGAVVARLAGVETVLRPDA